MTSLPQASTTATGAADEGLAAALGHCRQLTRARGRNFYYGLKLTPEPKRSAMYAIYAFMRACDDLVDRPGPGASDGHSPLSAQMILERVGHFRARMQANLSGDHPAISDLPPAEQPMWLAFRWVMRQYAVDPTPLHAMLDGQCLDLTASRYDNFEALYDYCYKVASTVGLVCIDIWGHDGQAATRKMAEWRGIALQMTNILRDLVEDVRRDRIYLPLDELARFGYGPGEFRATLTGAAAVDDRFDRLMAFQIGRTREHYERSADLEAHVDPSCRATCWAMMRIYRGLLEKIASRPRRVITSRVRLSSWRKLGIALTALRGRRRGQS